VLERPGGGNTLQAAAGWRLKGGLGKVRGSVKSLRKYVGSLTFIFWAGAREEQWQNSQTLLLTLLGIDPALCFTWI
jgi:hypothetical protein